MANGAKPGLKLAKMILYGYIAFAARVNTQEKTKRKKRKSRNKKGRQRD